jgi:hypothetical protein
MWTLKAAKEATELMKIISFILKLLNYWDSTFLVKRPPLLLLGTHFWVPGL